MRTGNIVKKVLSGAFDEKAISTANPHKMGTTESKSEVPQERRSWSQGPVTYRARSIPSIIDIPAIMITLVKICFSILKLSRHTCAKVEIAWTYETGLHPGGSYFGSYAEGSPSSLSTV